jgi:vancomycin resistance protein VanJ
MIAQVKSGIRVAVGREAVGHQLSARPVWRRLAALYLGRCVYLYSLSVLAVWILLHWASDRWWFATLLLYAPRWIWALPFAALVPAAVWLRPRLLVLLLVVLGVVVGPVMGFCVPTDRLFADFPAERGIRILTCNTEGSYLNGAALAALIAESRPDVVALQEWSGENEAAVFGQSGWHLRADPWFGLASRYPIQGAEALGTDANNWRCNAMRYDLDTPGGIFSFVNVHLATPRSGLEAVLHQRWQGIPELRDNIAVRWGESLAVSRRVREITGPWLLAGDFNLPVESAIYRQCWSGYPEAFASAGFGLGHTKFTRTFGLRIDHILAGPGWQFRRCWVGPDVGSDHRPVIADAVWGDVAD